MNARRLAPILLLLPLAAQAQAPTDSARIRDAALDYIHGWYNGDSVRMRRALHPALAKRAPVAEAGTGRTRIANMGADILVRSTGSGGGKATPEASRVADLKILAIDDGIATIRLVSAEFIDYMHLARVDGEWKILNVLWDFRPGVPRPPAPQPLQPPAGITVTTSMFRSLGWLTGSFEGSAAGGGSRFHERYRFLDDSTLEVSHFTDSTFSRESGPASLMTLRNGRVVYDRSVAIAFTETEIRFSEATGQPHVFTFTRGTGGNWTAVIDGRTPTGDPRRTVYQMRRIRS